MGVNIAGTGLEAEGSRFRWARLWMGFCPSAYLAVRYLSLALETAMGNPKSDENPMRWDRVVLNLPGSEDFDPTMP